MDSLLDICFDVRRLIYKAIRHTGDRLTIRCLLGTCKLIHSDIKSLKWGQITCHNRLAKAIGKQGTMAMFRWFEPIGIKPVLVYTSAISHGRVDAVRSLAKKFTFHQCRPIYQAFMIGMDAEIYKIVREEYKQFKNDEVVALRAIEIDNAEVFGIAERFFFNIHRGDIKKIILLQAIEKHIALSCLDYFWTKGSLAYTLNFTIDYRYNPELKGAPQAIKEFRMSYVKELIKYLSL